MIMIIHACRLIIDFKIDFLRVDFLRVHVVVNVE